MSDPTIRCIKESIAKKGFPPSVKELAQCLGVGVATAHARLIELEARGLIERHPGLPRALRILEEE